MGRVKKVKVPRSGTRIARKTGIKNVIRNKRANKH
jgi:hypothetical protein